VFPVLGVFTVKCPVVFRCDDSLQVPLVPGLFNKVPALKQDITFPGEEVGFYTGCIEIWAQALEKDDTLFTPR
jgi:hypothetical protein